MLVTLFGEQIAIQSKRRKHKEIETIEARNKPTKYIKIIIGYHLQPFLNTKLGVKTRLIYERLRARSEI